MGESFILVNLVSPPSGDKSGPRLKLKLYGGPCPGEVFYFSASDYYETYIKIGRLPFCDVQIEDILLSKI